MRETERERQRGSASSCKSSEKPCEFYARLLAKNDEQKRAQNIVKKNFNFKYPFRLIHETVVIDKHEAKYNALDFELSLSPIQKSIFLRTSTVDSLRVEPFWRKRVSLVLKYLLECEVNKLKSLKT